MAPQPLTEIPLPYSQTLVASDLIVDTRWDALKHGIDLDKHPMRMNVFSRERVVHLTGFGATIEEAHQECLGQLSHRLVNRDYACAYLGNGVGIRNGANEQYVLSATLCRKDPRWENRTD